MRVIVKLAKMLGRNPSSVGHVDLFKTKSVRGPGKFYPPKFWPGGLIKHHHPHDWSY